MQIYIFQNCLNDLAQDNKAKVSKMLGILSRAKPGSLFVVLDLAFDHCQQSLLLLQEKAALWGVGNVLVPVSSTYKWHHSSFEYPGELLTLFNGEDRLIPKRSVKYYSLILQRRKLF